MGRGWTAWPTLPAGAGRGRGVGQGFASEIVGEVAGASEDALVEAFDEAERARLIAPGRYLVS